jgi:hypothetical protein
VADKPSRSLVPSKGDGVFHDLLNRVKLIVRLMGDGRVSPLLKLLPIGTLVYFVVPDLAPGPIDDAAIIWLGTYLFVELCPAEIVREHLNALTSVVDAEWRELDEKSGGTNDDTPPPDSPTPQA